MSTLECMLTTFSWLVRYLGFRSTYKAIKYVTICVFIFGIILLFYLLNNQWLMNDRMYGHQYYGMYQHESKQQAHSYHAQKQLSHDDVLMGIEDYRVKDLLPFHNQERHLKNPKPTEKTVKEIIEPYILQTSDDNDDNFFCNIYNIKNDINENYDCVSLKLSNELQPSNSKTILLQSNVIKDDIKVCLYPINEDIHISYHIQSTGQWEPHIVKHFQEILLTDPNMGVIDIGANIGVYSLIAAKMGHSVVSVEPFIDNIKHFHQAVKINKIADKITLLHNAILDKRGTFNLNMDIYNQGGVMVDIRSEQVCTKDCHRTTTIYLDDLLEVIHFKTAIIKIDIEGFEHYALRRSANLFNDLDVPYIIMEWLKLGQFYGSEMTKSKDKTLTDQIVKTLHLMGYTALSLVTGERLSPNHWFGWPNDILWKHSSA